MTALFRVHTNTLLHSNLKANPAQLISLYFSPLSFYQSPLFPVLHLTMRKTHRPPDSDAPTTGILAGIFKRLLCGNHSRFSKTCDANLARTQKTIEKSNKPSVIASLMGLESMPESDSLPCSIGRSRSVNSLGEWPQLLSQNHRRNRTCSFRETPVFLQQENDDYILFSFKISDHGNRIEEGIEESDHSKRVSGEYRVVEEKVEVKKQVSSRRGLKKESRVKKERVVFKEIRNNGKTERWVLPDRKGNLNSKSKNRGGGGVKQGKKRKGFSDRKVEPIENLRVGFGSNCSSEISSPVSVLDLPETGLQHIESTPYKCDSRLDLRLELSSSGYPSENLTIHRNSFSGKEDEPPQGCFSGRSREVELWSEICRLAQEEMKNVNWLSVKMGNLEYVETIGIEIGLQLLDHLLQESLDDLVCISQDRFLKSCKSCT